MPDVMHLIRIRATPERLYTALSTADGIRNWWTRDADLECRPGGTGEFRFYDRSRLTRVCVSEATPFARVGWTVVASDAPGGWAGTTILFDLRPENQQVKLIFAHRGFAAADEDYALVTTGWAYYLVSLQHYLETGRGAPHPDIDFGRMLSAH